MVREGPQPKTIVTKFKRVPDHTVPPGQTNVAFHRCRGGPDLPDARREAELEAYVVYVGFDEIGDRNEKETREAGKPGIVPSRTQ